METSESPSLQLDFSRWKQYVVVLGGVWLATLIRFPVKPFIHNASPFLFYLPVVIAVAIGFGPRLGLVATALSVLPANYFWMVPERTFSLDLGQFCQILGFSFAGCSVSWLSSTARKRKQLEEHLRATLACMGDAVVTTDCKGRIIYLNGMAQVLTELTGNEPVGCTIGSALNLVAEDGQHSLNGEFQIAINEDQIEDLPKRLLILSKTGRQYSVEQKTSRILDARGRKLGMAILFHPCEISREQTPRLTVKEDPHRADAKLPAW